jgi:hypothetical protein
VQEVRHRDGRRSHTIVDPANGLHPGADRFLPNYAGKGTDRTYAHLLVDHLRWLEQEALTPAAAMLDRLVHHVAVVGLSCCATERRPDRGGVAAAHRIEP